MTSTAQKIINLHNIDNNYTAALKSADLRARSVDQDYQTETSYFNFDDDSTLKMCSVDYSVQMSENAENAEDAIDYDVEIRDKKNRRSRIGIGIA